MSRKLQEIRPKLLFMTNRKLHMRFRLTPTLMTLDDLELYVWIFREFLGISQILDATTSKRMKIHHCHACRAFVSDSWAFLFVWIYTLFSQTEEKVSFHPEREHANCK